MTVTDTPISPDNAAAVAAEAAIHSYAEAPPAFTREAEAARDWLAGLALDP